MQLFRRTTWISRPPEDVFDFFVDFSQASRWRQYVRTMEPRDDGPLRPGSRIHVTMDLAGGAYAFDLEVLAIERPSHWRHRTDEKDFFGYIEYRFETEGDGTRVTMLVEAKPVGLYGWLGMPLVWLGRNKAYTEQLPRLKRALEEP
jgi:uncharacterized protein YndB with AHSA1/START domain